MGIENESDSIINRMGSLRDRLSGRDFVGCGPSSFFVYLYILSRIRTHESEGPTAVNGFTSLAIGPN